METILQKINPTVIHVHHPFLLGHMAVQYAKKCGIKTVFTYHTIYEAYVHYENMYIDDMLNIEEETEKKTISKKSKKNKKEIIR